MSNSMCLLTWKKYISSTQYILFILFFVLPLKHHGQRKVAVDKSSIGYKKAKGVFDNLLRAMELKKKPAFKFWEKPDNITNYNLKDNSVNLYLKDYKVCESMGNNIDNALAFLLGHELIHFKRSHPSSGFSKTFAINDPYRKQEEIVADSLGFLYGCIAGYNTLEAGPSFLKKYYKARIRKADTVKYPSPQQRIEISKKISIKLNKLFTLLEIANVLTVLREYNWANIVYNSIIEEFPSREIWNNMGVNELGRILDVSKYLYPLELDSDTHLNLHNKRIRSKILAELSVKEKEKIFAAAAFFFEKAISLDPGYASSYINLASVMAMQKNKLDSAITIANKGLKIARKRNLFNIVSDAEIVKAIAYYKKGDRKEAEKSIRKIQSYSKALKCIVASNLDKITWVNKKLVVVEEDECLEDYILLLNSGEAKGCYGNDGEKIAPFHHKFQFPPINSDKFMITDDLVLFKEDKKNAVYAVLQRGENHVGIQKTKSIYKSSSGGKIRIGDPLEKIYECYGSPLYVQKTSGSERFLVYKNPEIIFSISNENEVKGWVLYFID